MPRERRQERARAGASAKPVPGWLTMRTPPSRAAASRPGTPVAVGRQLQRIDAVASLATQQHADRLQATQGLQEQPPAANRQVAAFHQRAGQLARQQDVAEPVRIGMAGGQQRDAARVADAASLWRRHLAVQRVLPEFREVLQRAEQVGGEEFREDAAEPAAVFQRMGQTVGPAGAVRQHAPCAVGAAHQVGGVELQQPGARLRGRLAAGTEEAGIAIDQGRRQDALGEQTLRAVEVAQHRVQQTGALGQAGRQAGEVGLRQRYRDRVEAPGVGRGTGEQGGDALFGGDALQALCALDQGRPAEARHYSEQTPPVRAESPFAVNHLVQRHEVEAVPLRWPSQVRRWVFAWKSHATGSAGGTNPLLLLLASR